MNSDALRLQGREVLLACLQVIDLSLFVSMKHIVTEPHDDE